jgi:hypothetical protein
MINMAAGYGLAKFVGEARAQARPLYIQADSRGPDKERTGFA